MTTEELISHLVAFNTVSRHSNLALIDFIRNYLDDYGVSSQCVFNDDQTKANLYATIGPSVADGVVLSGHTDVVPVEGQAWDRDPFTVTERDGRLYGRGTCDMKSFIAIALALLPEMTSLKRPIHLAFSYDEEVGCQGAPRLIAALRAHLPRPVAVIVGEPTEMQVVNAHKGVMALTTTVNGSSGHSSQIHRGVSAVMTAARLITYLEDLARERLRHPPVEGFDPPFTTLHVGRIAGGTAVNVIAHHCAFDWDIRNVPDDDPSALVQQFAQYCREAMEPTMHRLAPTSGIHTQCWAHAPALKAQDSTAVQLALTLTGQQTTTQVSFATEAGQFQVAGFPVVVCGPGAIAQAHQPNEFIERSQLALGTAFMQRLIALLSR